MKPSAIDSALDAMAKTSRQLRETGQAARDAATQPEATATPRPITLERAPALPLPKAER